MSWTMKKLKRIRWGSVKDWYYRLKLSLVHHSRTVARKKKSNVVNEFFQVPRSCRKTAKSIKILKIWRSAKRKFGVSYKTVLGNVVRKLHAKFHRTSLIRKYLKSGERKVLRRSRRNYFWSDFGIFQSRVKT